MQYQDLLELNKNDSSAQRIVTAADLILHYLEQIGVEYVFGIPGGGIEPFYDALARSQRRGGPRTIVARHESGAAFMADGYARETGKLGVCCATTGPGATNMITGVASAYMDHTPLLAITAQTSLKSFGRGAAQESSCTGVNTVAMYQHCTRYNTFISHIDQLESKLITAITTAMHPPYGPAHLSIPMNILRETSTSFSYLDINTLITPSNAIDSDAVDQLFKALYRVRNIIFVLGTGAWPAKDAIMELALILNAQVVTTSGARGLVNSFHPQYRGAYGIAGHATAHALLMNKQTDLILVIGTNIDEFSTNGWEPTELFSNKVVFIDSSYLYFTRLPLAHQYISGNISAIFSRLLTLCYRSTNTENRVISLQDRQDKSSAFSPVIPFERRANDRRHENSSKEFKGVSYPFNNNRRKVLERRKMASTPPANRHFILDDEDKYLSDATPIKPQRLMYELSRLLPPNTRYLADNGNGTFWTIHYLHPTNRRMIGHRLPANGAIRMGMGYLSMGWAIGAAVGTALGGKDNPVICITGDGSLLMSGQELTVAIQEKLPIVFVILNDSALGTVKHGQRLGKSESIAFELPRIDFVNYAKAMGAYGYLVESPQDLINIDVMAMCKRSKPTVLDVRIDPDEVPPIESRITILKG